MTRLALGQNPTFTSMFLGSNNHRQLFSESENVRPERGPWRHGAPLHTPGELASTTARQLAGAGSRPWLCWLPGRPAFSDGCALGSDGASMTLQAVLGRARLSECDNSMKETPNPTSTRQLNLGLLNTADSRREVLCY